MHRCYYVAFFTKCKTIKKWNDDGCVSRKLGYRKRRKEVVVVDVSETESEIEGGQSDEEQGEEEG